MKDLRVENILGYSVVCGGANYCTNSIMSWVAHGDRCRKLVCINPHSYVRALRKPHFSIALKAADWLIPDGAGIVLASRFLGGVIKRRITGSVIFESVMQQLDNNTEYSVFFLGSAEETLAMIRSRVARDFPHVRITGTYSPPFKEDFTEEEYDVMVDVINKAAPDVLWVGMTAPKQELWIECVYERLTTVKFVAAIGAVFDFYSGRVKRSHPVFQRVGLEWLPRFVRQPRRLWRRIFVSAPVFVWQVLRHKFKNGSDLQGDSG